MLAGESSGPTRFFPRKQNLTEITVPTAHEPLSYHAAVRDYLRHKEQDVWEWYAQPCQERTR